MTTLPEKFEITVNSGAKPVKGLLVRLTIGAKQKNDYTFILGPTDESGKATITSRELINEANMMRRLALMDYGKFEHNHTDEICAAVMTKHDIDGAIKAFELYGPVNYPPGYIDLLYQALKNSREIKGLKVNVVHLQT